MNIQANDSWEDHGEWVDPVDPIEWGDPVKWTDLSEGQRSIFMEFYSSPMVNNLKIMPRNDDYIFPVNYTPTSMHISAFTYEDGSLNISDAGVGMGIMATRVIRDGFTDGQKNAIILWLTEDID